MSTLFHSIDINLDTKESAFKFPLLPIGVANLKLLVKQQLFENLLEKRTVMSISIDIAKSYAPANKPLSLLCQSYAPIRNNPRRNSIQREINLGKNSAITTNSSGIQFNCQKSNFPSGAQASDHLCLHSFTILMQYVYSILNGNLKSFISLALLEFKLVKDPFPFHQALQAKIGLLKQEGKLYTVDRALKMRFNKGSGSFLQPTIPESWNFFQNQLHSFQDKIIHKKKKILNNFLSQNKGFQPPKNTKKYSFEYNDCDVYLTKAKSRRLRIETASSEYLTTKNLQHQNCP